MCQKNREKLESFGQQNIGIIQLALTLRRQVKSIGRTCRFPSYVYVQGRPSGLKSGDAEWGGAFWGILEPTSSTR